MPLAGSYLDSDGLAAISIAPADLISGDWVDPTGLFTDPAYVAARAAWQTFRDTALVAASSEVNARCNKRYAVPFGNPAPVMVQRWVSDLVTAELYLKRGSWTSDQQMAEILKRRDVARAQMFEAANSETGLYDLPLSQADEGTSGISKGAPIMSSQASHYAWMDQQIKTIRSGG